jgi:hypothetical protein
MDLKSTTIEEELVAVWKLSHEGRAKFFSPSRRMKDLICDTSVPRIRMRII